MTTDGPSRPRGRERAVALVLTLVVVLVLALLALTLAFITTLDTLVARHAQEQAVAEGRADGALALAAAAVPSLSPSTLRSGARLGPWPAAGIDAQADVVADAAGVVWVTARATVGHSEVVRVLAAEGLDAGAPRVLLRP